MKKRAKIIGSGTALPTTPCWRDDVCLKVPSVTCTRSLLIVRKQRMTGLAKRRSHGQTISQLSHLSYAFSRMRTTDLLGCQQSRLACRGNKRCLASYATVVAGFCRGNVYGQRVRPGQHAECSPDPGSHQLRLLPPTLHFLFFP